MADALLDTNIVSELRKRQNADPAVRKWLDDQSDDELFLSVATFGEIRMGIERLRQRDPVQAAVLNGWALDLGTDYTERILDITREIFDRWGCLQAIRPIGAVDCLLAATAIEHDFTLVTRNIDDFRGLGVRLLNPFTGEKL